MTGDEVRQTQPSSGRAYKIMVRSFFFYFKYRRENWEISKENDSL